MTPTATRSGFVLVTVLIVTAIGMLFGVGSMYVFRLQCQQRIERQRELEEQYAVRSALNYIRTSVTTDNSGVPSGGKSLVYHTESIHNSDRSMNLLVKPVEVIFPSTDGHYNIETDEVSTGNGSGEYNATYDVEFGSDAADMQFCYAKSRYENEYGLACTNLTASNNVKGWVNIGMRNTGSWLQSQFGRRYFFHPGSIVEGSLKSDTVRLCLVRDVEDLSRPAGARHGWPLSNGECALVLEISSAGNVVEGAGSAGMLNLTLYESTPTNPRRVLLPTMLFKGQRNMGMQISGNLVTVFCLEKEPYQGYTALACEISDQTVRMSPEVYAYFAEGCDKNPDGSVNRTADVRLVLEVEAAREGEVGEGAETFLSRVKVTEAYQYQVFMGCPDPATNLATVAEKIGEYTRSGRTEGLGYTILTYDTHGRW